MKRKRLNKKKKCDKCFIFTSLRWYYPDQVHRVFSQPTRRRIIENWASTPGPSIKQKTCIILAFKTQKYKAIFLLFL